MKKVILSLAIVAIGALSANAQSEKAEKKDLRFSVGVEGSLPLGDFKEGYKFGIGGTVQADLTVAENLAITLNSGYITYSGKTISGFKVPSANLIPILAGVKYHFTEQIYGSAQAGVSIFNNDGGTNFTYAPGIGFQVSENFDILAKYTGYSVKGGGSFSAVGLRIAYSF